MDNVIELESGIKTLLCEDDVERELDSIEVVMVASFLAGKNIEVEDSTSHRNTIKKWSEWLTET